MAAFNLGLKVIRRLCQDQNPMTWYKAKLSDQLFKGEREKEVFGWVNLHLTKHHALPSIETIESKFPEFKEFTTSEPASYYLELLENRFGFETINKANIDSQAALAGNKDDIIGAQKILAAANEKITQQRLRTRIMDMAVEAPKLVLQDYHNVNQQESKIIFGWEYMDQMTGGAMPGDIISYVGRPASGKTFKMLYGFLKNWMLGQNVLFASMEMNHLAVAQRAAAMYAHTGLTQLKLGGYSSQTYKKFADSLMQMASEKAKAYVVDGNLAAHVDDIYLLAQQLGCKGVWIDGAYLLKSRNPRLDRFTKVAENVEHMKSATTEIEIPTFASWQFNRDASKKVKTKEAKVGLEDIGYTDAIGQISSIVMGLFQEEGVETMNSRIIDVMKGRSGEVGQFKILWDFLSMEFGQMGVEDDNQSGALEYI
jgi:replicative DNA helicase